MNTFDQKGFNVTDLMGNHYLFCDPFDAGIEVTPTHLTYVSDAFYCRDFLLDLCLQGSLSESLRDLYKYARPHNYQLYKLSDWDIIDQLIHMLVTEELKVWQLKDGLWDNAPEHIGNDVPMAGSSGNPGQAPARVTSANKKAVTSNGNDNEKIIDSQKKQSVHESNDSIREESTPRGNTLNKERKWKSEIVADRKVYQRDDLFDPKRVDAFGKSNVERMQKGLAPIGYDGEEVNLHHVTQDEPGSMAELSSVFHSENDRLLHIYTNQYDKSYKGADGERHRYSSAPPSMNRKPFNKWKKKYWKERANDFV